MYVWGVTFGGYIAKILSFKSGNLLFKWNFYLLSEATVQDLKLGESFLFNLCGKCGLSKNASEESDTSIMWKVRALRRFLNKCKQMFMGSRVKAFCSISVETAGSQKMHRWKVILLYLWKVRVLRIFFDKMQQVKLGESFLFYICEECGLSENTLI